MNKKKIKLTVLLAITALGLVLIGCSEDPVDPENGLGNKTFTVTFSAGNIANVTNLPDPITGIKYEETITFPAKIPVRNGFEFNDWRMNEPGGPRFAASTKITSDITLYAGWTENFTVTFSAGGIAGVTFLPGPVTNLDRGGKTTIAVPSERPERAGYSFDGWRKGSPAGEKWNFFIDTVTSSIILYAGWVEGEGILFYDNFDGPDIDPTKWERVPEWERQDRSSWKDDMVDIVERDGTTYLRIRARREPELAPPHATTSNRNNWIRTGGIRTRRKNNDIIWENNYGYYEAKIKFPVNAGGTWGAFWLHCRAYGAWDRPQDGTEIDIVESIYNNQNPPQYNAAVHWAASGNDLRSLSSSYNAASYPYGDGKPGIRPVNVYDGNFHTFALDWQPDRYVFYVNDIEFWRLEDGWRVIATNYNPFPNTIFRTSTAKNYMKFSYEGGGGSWSGNLTGPIAAGETIEMLVEWVRVYKERPADRP